MTRQFLLAGHSHAIALGLPADLPSGPTRLLPLSAGVPGAALAGTSPRTDEYWDFLVTHAANSDVVLLFHGNQHLAQFLFASDPAFDFFLSEFPDACVDETVQLVPEAMVRELLGQGNAELRSILAKLKGVPGCRAIVVGTPPPKGNDSKLRELLAKELHFVRTAERAGKRLDSIPLTPADVRWKLWSIVQSLLSEAAMAEGAIFVPVTPIVIENGKFLREEFWRNDVTHANEAYGTIIWQNIQAVVEELDVRSSL